MKKLRPVLVVLWLAASLMTGCASNDCLVEANYAQIQQHVSTHSDVQTLIGEPDNKLGSMWLYERPDQHLTVMIDFDENGRVTRKQWVDGMGGAWHDTDDARTTRP